MATFLGIEDTHDWVVCAMFDLMENENKKTLNETHIISLTSANVSKSFCRSAIEDLWRDGLIESESYDQSNLVYGATSSIFDIQDGRRRILNPKTLKLTRLGLKRAQDLIIQNDPILELHPNLRDIVFHSFENENETSSSDENVDLENIRIIRLEDKKAIDESISETIDILEKDNEYGEKFENEREREIAELRAGKELLKSHEIKIKQFYEIIVRVAKSILDKATTEVVKRTAQKLADILDGIIT